MLEKRELLASDLLQIEGVYAASSGWPNALRSAIESDGHGHEVFGYALKDGADQAATIPWTEIDEFSIRFSKSAVLEAADLELLAGDGTRVGIAPAVGWNQEEGVATFHLDNALEMGDYQLRLLGTVESSAGDPLDGYWQQGVSSFPTDSQKATSDFLYRFQVLPGDTDQSGRVTVADIAGLRGSLGAAAGADQYLALADFDGSGRVTVSDIGPLRQHLGRSVTAANFAPVVRDAVAQVQEDGTLTFDLLVQDSDGDALTYEIMTPASHGQAQISEDGQLVFSPTADYFGTDSVVYRVSDGRAASGPATISIVVEAVNDPPELVGTPNTISLVVDQPSASVSLYPFFFDVDADSLEYRIDSYPSDILTAQIVEDSLVVVGLDGKAGAGNVVVTAADQSGDSVSLSFPVDVRLNKTVELPSTVLYALAQDHVLEYGGQSVVVLDTNLDTTNGIIIESADESTIAPRNVSAEPIGDGKVQIKIRHRTDDYGLTFLKFTIAGQVISEVAVIVTPPVDRVAEPVGAPTVRVEQTSDGEGATLQSRTINTRWLAQQVARGSIKAATAFEMMRVVDPIGAAVMHTLNAPQLTLTAGLVASGSTARSSAARSSSQAASTGDGEPYPKLFETKTITGCAVVNGVKQCWADPDLPPHEDPLAGIKKTLSATDWDKVGNDLVKHYTNPITVIVGGTAIDTVLVLAEAYVENTDFTALFGKDGSEIQRYAELAIDIANLRDIRNVGRILRDPKEIKRLLDEITDLARKNDLLGKAQAAWKATYEYLDAGLGVAGTVQDLQKLFDDGIFDGDLQQTLDSMVDVTIEAYKLGQYIGDVYEELGKQFPDFQHLFDPVSDSIKRTIDQGRAVLRGGVEEAFSPIIAGEFDPAENNKSLFGSDIVGVGQDLYGIAKAGISIADTLGDIFGGSGQDDPNRPQTIRLGDSSNDEMIQTGDSIDDIETGSGNDRIVSGRGDDIIIVGDGMNHVIAGGGDDTIIDGIGDSILSGGAGHDAFVDYGGSDVFEGGLGRDIFVFSNASIGNDRILDPSLEGEIRIDGHDYADLQFRKDQYDLEIVAPKISGRANDSVRFVDFFKLDRSGWTIRDRTGSVRNLYELTGRLDPRSALKLAMLESGDLAAGFVLPTGTTLRSSIDVTAASGNSYTVDIIDDDRAADLDRTGITLIVHGSRQLDGLFSRLPLGGLEDADAVLTSILDEINFDDIGHATIIGTGDGGVIAQWVAAAISTQLGEDAFSGMANLYAVNAPDVSGLITETIGSTLAEYRHGMPKLTSTFMVHNDDWASRLSMWAGNELSYSSWIRWFDSDDALVTRPSNELIEVREAHTLSAESYNAATMRYSPMSADEILAHVRLADYEDFDAATARQLVTIDGEVFQSTQGWTEVLIVTDDVEVPTAADASALLTKWETDRDDLVNHFISRPHAAPTTHFRFDFGPNSGTAAVEPGFIEINPGDRYIDSTTFGFDFNDTGLGAGDTGRASDLERDYVSFSDATFVVDVEPGIYDIALTMGDRDAIREDVRIDVNGYSTDVISTLPGSFLTRHYRIHTIDGTIRLRMRDTGGDTANGVINSLVITAADYRTELAASETNDDDAALIVLTHGYDLTPLDLEQISDAFVELVVDVVVAVATGPATGFTSTALILAGSALNFASNFTTNPLAKGILGASGTALSLAGSAPKIGGAKTVVEGISKAKKGIEFLDKGLKNVASALDTGPGSVREQSRVHDWVFEAALKLSDQAQRFSLDALDSNVIPVDFADADQIIRNAIENPPTNSEQTDRALLNLWEGSRDFLALDWADLSNDGIGLFGSDEAIYRNSVNRAARVYKRLIEAHVARLRKNDPDAELDILMIAHGTGYNVNRELVGRLNESDFADALDYVKFVSLAPISTNRDELEETEFQSDKYEWYHPEMTSILSSVDNYYQTTSLYESNFFAFAQQGLTAFGAGVVSELVENRIDEELHFGEPLDGREGGGQAGFYNRSARLFQFTDSIELDNPDGVSVGIGEIAGIEEILRFRHWDPNTAQLTPGELTDVQFSDDGLMLAAASRDGSVTVRTIAPIDALIDAEGTLVTPARSAGAVLYNVYQHGADYRGDVTVNSTRFSQDSARLLTTSNTAGTILVTDATTGKPLWRGEDVGVRRAAFSPDRGIIVSVDDRGNALVWKRIGDSDQYARLTPKAVPLHGDAIADLVVVDNETFITGSTDKRLRVWSIGNDDRITMTEQETFAGSVRNLDYDLVSGLVAVGGGQRTYLYRLTPGDRLELVYTSPDHTAAIQGVAFNAPVRTVDIEDPSTLYAGLKLFTGGEDRTIFRLDLSEFDRGLVRRTAVISGAMLPIAELSVNPVGDVIAVVGQDNVSGDYGGPVKDINVTDGVNDRVELKWDRWFVDGQRQHNALPFEYLDTYVDGKGESFLWDRNNDAASRPGAIDRGRNLTLPAFKRGDNDQQNFETIDLYVRPGETLEFFPRRYLIAADKDDFKLTQYDDPDFGSLLRPNGQNNTLLYTAPSVLPSGVTVTSEVSIQMTGIPKTDGDIAEVRSTIARIHVVNEAPITVDDRVRTYPGTTVEIPVRANDYDFEDDNLDDIQIDLSGGGMYGVLTRKPDRPNVLVYTVAAGVDISDGDLIDTFTYSVRDAFGASSTGNIIVTVGDYEGPQNVAAIEVGADQLRMVWDNVGWNANQYRVLMDNGEADPRNWTVVATSDGNIARVRNLDADTPYRFVVAAKLGQQESLSDIFPIRTPEYVPVDVAGIDVTPRTVQLDARWEPVFWDVANYLVELGHVDGDGNFIADPDVDAKSRREDQSRLVTFKELRPDTIYHVRITALGDAQSIGGVRSIVSTPRIARTLTRGPVESVARDRVGPNKVQVSWTDPGWTVQKYRVIVADSTGSEIMENGSPKYRVGNIDPTDRTATITGLDTTLELERYVIYVEALDAAGNWISPHPDASATPVQPTQIIDESIIVDAAMLGRSHLVEFESDVATEAITLTLPPLQSVQFGDGFRLFNTSGGTVAVSAAAGENLRFDGELNSSATLTGWDEFFADGTANEIDLLKRTVTYTVYADAEYWRVIRTGSALPIEMSTRDAADLRETFAPQLIAFPFGMELRWQRPFWNVDQYDLMLRSIDGTESYTKTVNDNGGTHYSHRFQNLTVGLHYQFELVARGTQDGEPVTSEPWLSADNRFPTGQLAATLSEFDADSLTPTRAVLRWQYFVLDPQGDFIFDGDKMLTVPAAELNLDNLKIEFATDTNPDEFRDFDSLAGNLETTATEAILTDLKPARQYQFRIVSVYPQEPKRSNIVDLPERPDPAAVPADQIVESVEGRGRRQLAIRWPATNFDVKNYAVWVQRVDENDAVLPGRIAGDDVSGVAADGSGLFTHTFTGLSPETRYVAAVAPKNAAADINADSVTDLISYSNIMATVGRTAATDVQASAVIDAIVVTQTNANMARITWRHETVLADIDNLEFRVQKRRCPNGVCGDNSQDWDTGAIVDAVLPTNGQTVQVYDKTIGPDVRVNGQENQYTVLNPFDTYEFRVVADYNAGDNLPSQVSEPLTMPAPPPINLKPSETDFVYPTSARFTWRQVFGVNVTDFELIATDRNTNQQYSQIFDRGTGEQSRTINGLPAGTELDLVIRALDNGSLVSQSVARPIITPIYRRPRIATDPADRFGVVMPESVQVKWSYDDTQATTEAIIERFQIVRKFDGGGENVLGSTSPSERAAINDQYDKMIDRATNANWNIFIRAVFRDGHTEDSDEFTLPQVATVEAALQTPTGSDLGATDVWLRWTHPGSAANVVGFRIFKLNQSEQWVLAKDNLSANTYEFQLTNSHTKLIPSVTYSFRVDTIYAGVTNPPSNEVTVTMADAGAPMNVRETGPLRRLGVTVQWDAPNPPWEVKDYLIKLTKPNGNVVTQSVGASTFEATFTDLDADTVYPIEVVARNTDIDSGLVVSSRGSARTEPYVIPSRPVVSNVQFTSMTVSWSHSDLAGAPDEFAIFRNGNFVTNVRVNATGQYAYTDTGRTPGQTYTYFVRAKYALNPNVDSATSLPKTTLSTVVPSGFSITQSGSGNNTFSFNWTHLVPAGATGLVSYRIERRAGTGSFGSWKAINTTTITSNSSSSAQSWVRTRSQLDPDAPLNAGTTYRFKVIAIYEGSIEVESDVFRIPMK